MGDKNSLTKPGAGPQGPARRPVGLCLPCQAAERAALSKEQEPRSSGSLLPHPAAGWMCTDNSVT